MKNKSEIVAIIPARGNSKSVPRKNLAKIRGIPMINYTIKEAKKCKLIDRIICSTENKEIANIAKKAGAEVPFLRPKSLSRDNSHTSEVIYHAVKFLEKKNIKIKLVVILQATSPLRKAKYISDSIKKIISKNYASVVTVTKAYPPWWTFTVEKNKLKQSSKLKKIDAFNLERQQLPTAYKCNGAVYVTKRSFIKPNTCFNVKNCGYVYMKEKDSYDVDTYEDLLKIKKIMEN